jgi:hypothetical protein
LAEHGVGLVCVPDFAIRRQVLDGTLKIILAEHIDVAKTKEAMIGNWESVAPEVRPSATKNPDGSLKPFDLKRAFKYLPSDRFELEIMRRRQAARL